MVVFDMLNIFLYHSSPAHAAQITPKPILKKTPLMMLQPPEDDSESEWVPKQIR